MAKVKLKASLYPYGKNGDTVEIPDSEIARFGSDIEVLDAPKKEAPKPKNRKLSGKAVKTKKS